MTTNETTSTVIDQVEALFKTISEAVDKYSALQDVFAKEMHSRAIAFQNNPTIEGANEVNDIHSLAAYMQEYLHTSNGDEAAEMEETHVIGLYRMSIPAYDQAQQFTEDLSDKINTFFEEEYFDELDIDDDL